MKLPVTWLPLLLALHLPAAHAQQICNKGTSPAPVALFERFLSADCQDCWSDARTPAPGATAAVLDWIVPSAAGDDAPLSAAASRDALARLASIQRTAPASTDVHVAALAPTLPGQLRVSLGPAINDYVTGSVSYAGPLPSLAGNEWTVGMALVEALPAGADGTAVSRNLVRNLFQAQWDRDRQLSRTQKTHLPRNTRWIERRAMQIATGANPERLTVVAWLQDAQGRVVAMARGDCISEK